MRHLVPTLCLSLLWGALATTPAHAALASGGPPALVGGAPPTPRAATALETGSAFEHLSLESELQARGMMDRNPPRSQGRMGPHSWPVGAPLLQGYFGASLLEGIDRQGGSLPPADGADDDLAQYPILGGGAQWKLGGERVDFGFEGMLGFGWRANATAFAVGGGGAAIALNVDLTVFELYGGPFVSMFLNERLRAYAAAGPVMQWADYSQEGPLGQGLDGSGSGFGTGLYARTGLELATSPATLVGLGVRWFDTTVDLSGGLGDLDVDGLQVVLTVSRWM